MFIISTVVLNPKRTLYWCGILADCRWSENRESAREFPTYTDAEICWDSIRASHDWNPADPLSIERK